MSTRFHQPPDDSTNVEATALIRPRRVNWGTFLRPEFLVPLAVYLAQAVWLLDFSIDDASISFRYAKHLADGLGLRWNPTGPPVEGYSNFLWVILLALGRLIGLDIEFFAHLLGGFLGMVNLVLLHRLCARLWAPRRFWWIPVLLVAVCPVWVMWVMSGLEIALFGVFLLVIVLGLTASPRARAWLLAFAFAGLSLTRPEGIALAPIPLLIGWIGGRRESLRQRMFCYGIPVLILAVVSIGMLVFRLMYFGYPLANTVYAKFSPALPSAREVSKWLIFGLPFWAAWLVGWRSRSALPHLTALAAGIGLVIAQVILVLPVKPVMYFLHRYQIAFLPLLALIVPFVLSRISEHKRTMAVVIAAALVLWTLQGWPSVSKRHQSEAYAMQRQHCVVESLLSLPAGVTIALIDAGRIPYWSDLPAYDIWGLCDADIAHRGFSYESTLGRNPDVYVMSLNIKEGEVYPRLGFDVMVSGNPTFKEEFRLWRICAGTPPTIEWYYDYGIFINTDWAAQHGLSVQ